MASYDFIDASLKGYKLAFDESRYLIRLALVPVLIKFVCYVAVVGLHWEQVYTRQAIVLLPSFFAEGWLLAHLVRLIFLGQRWPFRPSGDEKKDMEVMEDRAQGIMAGALVYTLTKFLLTGLLTLGNHENSMQAGQSVSEEGDFSLILMAVSTAMFVFMVWAFRFLWLYIPVAVNYSIRNFLRGIQGFSTSFYLIGTWLVCFIPLSLLMLFFIGVFSSVGVPGEPMPTAAKFILAAVQVAIDTATAIVATAGMAYSIKAMAEKAAEVSGSNKKN